MYYRIIESLRTPYMWVKRQVDALDRVYTSANPLVKTFLVLGIAAFMVSFLFLFVAAVPYLPTILFVAMLLGSALYFFLTMERTLQMLEPFRTPPTDSQ
tara:strand:- start:6042 stop:6338 length:297 start_codon:yes stop_codon:yes gene_type:complete